MTHYIMKRAGLSAVFVAASAFAGSTQALAATDYYIKFDGVDGETKAAAKDSKHENWIEIASVRLAPENATPGGVGVASGDLKGSQVTAAGGKASGKHTYQPVIIRKRIDKSNPQSKSLKKFIATDDETTALLVPAIQKVREAAARIPAWSGCARGQKIESIGIKQSATGGTGRILDATISECALEQVSFNFTKIEWD